MKSIFEREIKQPPQVVIDPDLKKYLDFQVLEIVRYFRDFAEDLQEKYKYLGKRICSLENSIDQALRLLDKKEKHKQSQFAKIINLFKNSAG